MNILGLFPQFNPILNLGLTLNLYIIILMIAFIIIRRIRDIGAIRTLVFWKDGNHTIKNYKIKDGKLQIRPKGLLKGREKEWLPDVKPEHIVPPKKTLTGYIRPFGFKQKDLLIAVEDADECITLRGIHSVTLQDVPEKMRSILLKYMTREEVKKFISKAVAQAIVDRKVFSDKLQIIFIGIVFANLLMTFMIANYIGLF